ncbi:MAG: hypothetical protein QF570_13320 [Myxococcota bacterium]|jgi:hypothetical protein|nr:hypothetical protein [Myxococcota bacterium]
MQGGARAREAEDEERAFEGLLCHLGVAVAVGGQLQSVDEDIVVIVSCGSLRPV